jgi:hypothetical protein
MKMATKHFEFGYITSGDTPDDCSFDDVEFPHRTNITHSVSFSEDARWVNVLKQFAMFLDSTGYVGVRDAIDKYIDQKDAALYSLLNDEEDTTDEDTSNPGLSD